MIFSCSDLIHIHDVVHFCDAGEEQNVIVVHATLLTDFNSADRRRAGPGGSVAGALLFADLADPVIEFDVLRFYKCILIDRKLGNIFFDFSSLLFCYRSFSRKANTIFQYVWSMRPLVPNNSCFAPGTFTIFAIPGRRSAIFRIIRSWARLDTR